MKYPIMVNWCSNRIKFNGSEISHQVEKLSFSMLTSFQDVYLEQCSRFKNLRIKTQFNGNGYWTLKNKQQQKKEKFWTQEGACFDYQPLILFSILMETTDIDTWLSFKAHRFEQNICLFDLSNAFPSIIYPWHILIYIKFVKSGFNEKKIAQKKKTFGKLFDFVNFPTHLIASRLSGNRLI